MAIKDHFCRIGAQSEKMAKEKYFKYISAAPLDHKVATRDGTIYMYRLMKFIGWIPPKEAGLIRNLYKCWTIMTFVFGMFYVPVGCCISYYRDFKLFTPADFLTSLQVGINVVGSDCKCFFLYPLLWRLRKTEDILDELDKRVKDGKERKQLHETVAFANYVFLIFTITYNGYALSTFLSCLASGRPPWSIYNPFINWRDSVKNLVIQGNLEYFVMSMAVIQDQLADTYLMVFIILIRGHYLILKERVLKLRTDPEMSEAENYEELVNCVKDHKLIVLCCDTLRPIISGTIFIQFGLIGLVLGLTLINIFFFSNLWRGLASLMFIAAVLLETFPFCYYCNMLMDDSEDLGNLLFHHNWADASPRYKSTLVYYMHRVQQPITFIAGGIIPITMASNFTVAKFAFSIITIVKNMNLAEQFK